MPRGTCKLCLQEAELCDSHFLPASIYAQLRDPTLKNPNPVLMTKDISLTTSLQITDHVLCNACEQRFSALGETWVLANMARPEGFAIQEELLKVRPIDSNECFAYFSSTAMPAVDMDALVYFAMSVFWRAAVHEWRNVSGTMRGIDLGAFQEPIRLFLLGGAFPVDAVLLVSVWPTRDVFPGTYTPRRGTAPGYEAFNFLIPGLEFKLLLGDQIPDLLRAMCSHASPQRFIFTSMTVVDDTIDAFAGLAATSRVARGLQRTLDS
jgi:hypothetical protein